MESTMAADVPSASGFVKEEHEMGSWPPSGDQDNLDADGTDVDKCPICFQAMGDAFLSSCGHSFCYICIATHLNHKSSCPSCARYLTTEQLIPNFLLTKLMKKATASSLIGTSSPGENFSSKRCSREQISR